MNQVPKDFGRRGQIDHVRALSQMWVENGYLEIRQTDAGTWCALSRFNFTWALVVGLDESGYALRYCYEHQADASTALKSWNGIGHPSGPWIKCKGPGIDLLNPELAYD